jgi:hypothetical protein
LQTELLLVVVAKALAELVGMFLIGRGVLYVLAGEKRDANLFYQVICIVTNPVLRAVRLVTPKAVLDRHLPYVAFALAAWAWIAIVFWLLPEMCSWPTIDCRPLLEQKRGG